MSRPVYPHTASNDFVYTGRSGKAEEEKKTMKKRVKIFKMWVDKHNAASNNITNSMDKNVTHNHSFHFTAFYSMGPVVYATAPSDLSPAQNDIFHNRQWYERMEGDRTVWFETK